jgi:hypothetical protein
VYFSLNNLRAVREAEIGGACRYMGEGWGS